MSLLYDSWYEIMLHLNYKELRQLYQHKVSKEYNNIITSIIHNEDFWKAKAEKDFMIPIKGKTWQKSYESMTYAIQLFNLTDTQLNFTINDCGPLPENTVSAETIHTITKQNMEKMLLL